MLWFYSVHQIILIVIKYYNGPVHPGYFISENILFVIVFILKIQRALIIITL